MANHKKAEFTLTDQEISMVARALSHPARIAIMRILAEHKRFTCGEIVEILPLAQPTVSHHLKELLDADLIMVSIDGKRSLYDVNWKKWNKYTTELDQLLLTVNQALNL